MSSAKVSEDSPRSHWPITVLSVISSTINMLMPLALVRLLSPHDIGSFRVFFLYLTIIPAFALTSGIMSGLAYWSGQAERREAAMQVSAVLVLLMAAVGLVAAFLGHGVIAETFNWEPAVAVLFSCAVFGAIAGGFFEEACMSIGRIWTGALAYSGFEIVRTVVIVIVAAWTRELVPVLLAHTLLSALKVLIAYIYGASLGLVGAQWNVDSLRSVLSYAMPVSLAWVFGVFVNYADQLILSTWVSPEEFAYYSVGCLSIAPVLMIEQSVMRVLIPQLSEAFARKATVYARTLYRDAMGTLAFFFIPAAVGLHVFADPIIEILFTSRYEPSTSFLSVFAFSYLFLILPFDAIPRAKGRAGWILGRFVAFSVLSLVVGLVATWYAGAWGALFGLMAARGLMRLYGVWFIWRDTGWPVHEFLPMGSFARLGILCALLGGGSIAARPLFSSDIVWFLVCGGAFGVIYLSVGTLLRHRFDLHPSSPPRILVVVQCVDIGGLERMVLSLCDNLIRTGQWQVSVLAYDQSPDRQGESLIPEFAKRGISIEFFKKRRGFSPFVVYRIVRRVLSENISIVHTQDLGGLMYAVVAKILVLGRFRLMQTQHSFVHLLKNRRYAFYERLFSYFVDALTVVSEETRRQYGVFGYAQAKIHLIENGVSFTSHHPESVREERDAALRLLQADGDPWGCASRLQRLAPRLWVIYLARVHPVKGQDNGIALWSKLPDATRERAALVIVGPESERGERARLETLIRTLEVEDSVVCVGGTKDPHLWLRAADLYLSCSTYEGMPLGPLEALGSGLPGVLSNIPGHSFFQGMATFVDLPPDSHGASVLDGVISQIHSGEFDTEKRRRQGEILQGQFSLARMVERYEAVYRQLLKRHSA